MDGWIFWQQESLYQAMGTPPVRGHFPSVDPLFGGFGNQRRGSQAKTGFPSTGTTGQAGHSHSSKRRDQAERSQLGDHLVADVFHTPYTQYPLGHDANS